MLHLTTPYTFEKSLILFNVSFSLDWRYFSISSLSNDTVILFSDWTSSFNHFCICFKCMIVSFTFSIDFNVLIDWKRPISIIFILSYFSSLITTLTSFKSLTFLSDTFTWASLKSSVTGMVSFYYSQNQTSIGLHMYRGPLFLQYQSRNFLV